jgi:hypothetical protein
MQLRFATERRQLSLKRRLLVFGTVSLLALSASLPALADTATGTATVTGGSLTEVVGAPPSVSATLNGTDQLPTYTLPITATDARGTGAGWNLTITSTQFTTGPATLSTSASSVTGVTSACVALTTCTNPTNSIGYALTVPAAPVAPTAVKLFNATVNTGLGKFTVTPTVSVSIPANTRVGTYTSTITLAVVTGP